MAWYRCDVDNQYDGVTAYRRGTYYDLQGTPPAAFFTADSNYASSTQTSVGAGLTTDLDGNLYVKGSTIKKDGTAVITQADADTVSTAESADSTSAASSATTTLRNTIQLQEDTTVNLLVADTTAEKQAKIDAVPRSAIGGVTATFQIADGSNAETDTLSFDGFTYPIIIQGNSAEDELTKHTNQSAIVTFSSGGFVVKNCINVSFHNLKISANETGANRGIFIEQNVAKCSILGCYFSNNNTMAGGRGVFSDGSNIEVRACYFTNTSRAIYAQYGQLFSRDNDDTSTPLPEYGVAVGNGGVIAKRDTQPDGSTANELGSGTNGSVIR